MTENYEQQMKDSDMIFNQITKSGGFNNLSEVKDALILLYIPDMTISRAGISHALKRFEEHYKND